MLNLEIAKHYGKCMDIENAVNDLKREIINDLTDLIESLGGEVHFVTNAQLEEETADYDDAIMVHCEEEFGRESHTYVLEKIEIYKPTSTTRVLKATCHRLEYHGFRETLTPSLWWFSHDELARIYQAIMDNVASEGLDMIKKTGTEVEA